MRTDQHPDLASEPFRILTYAIRVRANIRRYGLSCPHCRMAGKTTQIHDRQAFREHLRSHQAVKG